MEGDIANGLKYIGAGLTTLGTIGAAIGVGNIFGSFLEAALRNPSAASSQQTNLYVGMALTEALGLFSIVIGFLILFVA